MSNKTTNWIKKHARLSVFAILTLLTLAGAILLRLHMISSAMPYPRHVDEAYITRPALKMIKERHLNPGFFNYPSLPIYLTAACFNAGNLQAKHNDEINNINDIRSVSYPYYTHPTVVMPAKILFALISVFSMALMALTAFRVYHDPVILFLSALILLFSNIYFQYSQQYLNVDIIGTFFIISVITHLILTTDKDNFLQKSIIPGILCGLTVASKYSLFLVITPPTLAILLFSNKAERGYQFMLLSLTMLLTFIIAVPFSLLDFTTFCKHITYEINHYRNGHPGFTGQPGIQQIIYYNKELLKDYGTGLAVLALIGVIALFKRNWKHMLIVISFPLLFLFYMSLQKVHITRNILSIFVFFALFAAVGITALYLWLLARLARLHCANNIKQLIAYSCVGIILFSCLPLTRPMVWAKETTDTRNQANEWIMKHIEKDATLVVPRELCMDISSLRRNYNIIVWRFKHLDVEEFKTELSALHNPFIIMPIFDYDRRWAGKELADKLNKISRLLYPLKTFAGNGVLVNYAEPVAYGNPCLFIASPTSPYIESD